MDAKKLERLRERYGRPDGDLKADVPFREALKQVFDSDLHQKKPYGDPPTLLDFPHSEDWTGLDTALIGVPMDLGVTNRPGARFGPRALRAIERVGPYHPTYNLVPANVLHCADVGDVPFRSRFSLEKSIEDIEAFYAKIAAAGLKPISAGGDHSITYPIMKALGAEAPLGMVHIDAHCDTAGPYDDEKFHHGGPFRLAVLDGVLDPDRCVQLGVRGSAELAWAFSYDSGMTVIHMDDFHDMGLPAVISLCREKVAGGPVYVSVDVDGIDPAYTPGTGTPEVGGLTPLEAQRLLRGLAGLPVVGGDLVEVAPQYDPSANTAHVGATMMFEILGLLADLKANGG
ncbi:MAG: agmatinase [Gammaproteobacteria bacterium]|nr:agmatinase [Gammaproteobacteria bacterium]